jgi:hypothetical protein
MFHVVSLSTATWNAGWMELESSSAASNKLSGIGKKIHNHQWDFWITE